MVIVVALRFGAMVLFLADVELAAQDRMNAVAFRRFEKMDRAINVAVVGNGDRFLADVRDALDQLFDIAGAVEQGVIGVEVQVGEFRHGLFFYFRSTARTTFGRIADRRMRKRRDKSLAIVARLAYDVDICGGFAEVSMDSVVTFLMTQNPEAAIAFYRDKLGLRFLRDDGFALVFDMDGVMLRIGKTKGFTPAPNTVLGWEARDIGAAMKKLEQQGVTLRALSQHGPGRRRASAHFRPGTRLRGSRIPTATCCRSRNTQRSDRRRQSARHVAMRGFDAVAVPRQAAGDLLGNHHRAVLAAGAAERQREIALAFVNVVR